MSVLRVPEEKLAVHNFWGWALSGGGVSNVGQENSIRIDFYFKGPIIQLSSYPKVRIIQLEVRLRVLAAVAVAQWLNTK